jgi:hypothetical protein
MKGNVRQGFVNGSVPPYGFRTTEFPAPENKGRKKRLDIDQAEAAIVRRIFKLYISEKKGRTFGVRGVASELNDSGVTMRGKKRGKALVRRFLKVPSIWENTHSTTMKPKPERGNLNRNGSRLPWSQSSSRKPTGKPKNSVLIVHLHLVKDSFPCQLPLHLCGILIGIQPHQKMYGLVGQPHHPLYTGSFKGRLIQRPG